MGRPRLRLAAPSSRWVRGLGQGLDRVGGGEMGTNLPNAALYPPAHAHTSVSPGISPCHQGEHGPLLPPPRAAAAATPLCCCCFPPWPCLARTTVSVTALLGPASHAPCPLQIITDGMADGKKELQASACAALGMVRQGDGGCRQGRKRRGEGEGSSHHFLPQLTQAPPLSIHQSTPASPDPPPPAQAAPFIGTPEPAFLRDLVKKLNAPAFQVRDGLRLLKAWLRSWPHPLAAYPLPSSLILSPPPLPPGAPRPAGRHRLVRPGHREPTWAHEGVTILARRGREVCCGGCTPSTRSH